MQQSTDIQALLQWQLAMGADEAIAEQPTNHLLEKEEKVTPLVTQAASPRPADKPAAQTKASSPPQSAPQNSSLSETIEQAKVLAQQASTLEALKEALMQFDGCPLKKTARHTVFAEGAPDSHIMFIGEAPGADEDRSGVPFCGASGQLLDKMLSAIQLNRHENCYITNTLFWRPPGNRSPTPEEIEICRPFVERHIELFAPKLIVLLGGTASKALLQESRGIMKLRTQPLSYQEIPVRATFHPSYLLRQPLQKKQAWQDLLAIRALIDDIAA